MTPVEFTLISSDGKEVFGTAWVPSKPKAVVCIIHGLGEHIGRFDHVANHLNLADIAVYGIDQRGHGRSRGKKGHAKSQLLWDDVESLMKETRLRHLDIPMFLYGHSWGGNVVSNFLLRRYSSEINGAVLSAPWLTLSFEPSPLELKLGKWMSAIYPAFTQSNKLKVEYLSRDSTVGEAYLKDPLVHDRISAGLFTEAVANGNYALEHANRITLPVLVIHGTDDNITSAASSQTFSESCPGQATLKLWPGMRHEPHNEYGKEEVLDYLSNWFLQNID